MRSVKSGRHSIAGLHAFMAMLVVAAGCSSATTFSVVDGGASDGGVIVATDAGGVTDSGKKKDSGKDTGTEEDDGGDGSDAAIGKDAGKDAAKVDASVTTVCAPGAVTGFTPTWKAPKALHSTACSAANAQLAVDCVFDPNADPTACNTFASNTANDACRQCVFSLDTDSTYGPIIIDSNNLGTLNYGGCVAALSSNTTSSGCGAKVQAVGQCEIASCASSCDPSAGAQALADYNKCRTDANAGVCSSYDTAATCADTLTATGGSAAACANGTTFVLLARNLAKLFCSP